MGNKLFRVIEKGSIVLQARVFSEIVRKLPTNEVEIEVANQLQTHIRSGKSEFHLNWIRCIEEYPVLPEVKDDSQFFITS